MSNPNMQSEILDRTNADLVFDFQVHNDASGENARADNRSEHHEAAGGIHDDAVARQFGYQGALVPGIIICAHAMPILVERWGKPWLTRGRIGMKHIRPAFDTETLSACFRFETSSGGEHAQIVVMRGDTVVAVGDAALVNQVPDIPKDLPRDPLPAPAELPLAQPDVLKPGQLLYTKPVHVDRAEHDVYLGRIGGHSGQWPYQAIHPFTYQQLTSHDAIDSFIYSTPGIHVSGETQMLDWAEPGEVLESSGRVTAVYERKGHHYFDTEQLVQTAQGRPIALCQRSVIYRAREAKAAQ